MPSNQVGLDSTFVSRTIPNSGSIFLKKLATEFIQENGPLKQPPTRLITSHKLVHSPVTTSTQRQQTTSSSTSNNYYPSYSEYNRNEFYSICVSILTAAAFAVFIMWRWLRMKSDLKRALREQEQIQQHERSSLQNTGECGQGECVDDITGSSNNGIRWPNNGGRYMLISNNREELQTYAATLINQLSNGDYRTPRQHQQMIDTARYCLQQLKLHARLTQHYRLQQTNSYYHGRNNSSFNSNYSTFNNSQRRSHHHRPAQGGFHFSTSSSSSSPYLHTNLSSHSLSPLHNLPPAPPVSSTSLNSAVTNDNLSYIVGPHIGGASTDHSRVSSTVNLVGGNRTETDAKPEPNEPPPAYESLLIKSSSLPSYYHLSDEK